MNTIGSSGSVLLLAFFTLVTPSFADVFGSGKNQFTIDFVTVGNPGNRADRKGWPQNAGSVPYVYNIGKYEISRSAITKGNSEGNLGITLDSMAFVPGGPRPEMPATGVSWNEAARFVNYLNTSQGYPAAYKFAKQPGDAGYSPNENIILWTPADPGYDANNLFRNSQAHYFLPNVNEWYKSAFYDPHANSGAGGYWEYPTGSNTLPTPVASGTKPGTVVWHVDSDPTDIMHAGGVSPYGTVAQAGNVWEWDETEEDLRNNDSSSFRGMRGGASNSGNREFISVWYRSGLQPASDFANLGFRVASVPEPSSEYLGAVSALGLLQLRRRANSLPR
ncbi:MAG: SUMF1/EgtB/PvdO family nonheme iron enzyme [Pirellulales bacterium]